MKKYKVVLKSGQEFKIESSYIPGSFYDTNLRESVFTSENYWVKITDVLYIVEIKD